MLDKDGDDYVFHCDLCSAYVETLSDEFSNALLKMKADGWRSMNIKGEWCHVCPNCDVRKLK